MKLKKFYKIEYTKKRIVEEIDKLWQAQEEKCSATVNAIDISEAITKLCAEKSITPSAISSISSFPNEVIL
jgi:hypothetical protein